jgi:hypothetical protein
MDIEKLIGLIIILNAIASVYASWRKKNKAKKQQQSQGQVQAHPVRTKTHPKMRAAPRTKPYDAFEPEEYPAQSNGRMQRKQPALRSQKYAVKKAPEKADPKPASTMSTHDWLNIISQELGLKDGETRQQEPTSGPHSFAKETEITVSENTDHVQQEVAEKSPSQNVSEEKTLKPVPQTKPHQHMDSKPISPAVKQSRQSRRSSVLRDLRRSQSLKKAIILKTILDKPTALKRVS